MNLDYGAVLSVDWDRVVSGPVPMVCAAEGWAAIVSVGAKMKVVRPTSKLAPATVQLISAKKLTPISEVRGTGVTSVYKRQASSVRFVLSLNRIVRVPVPVECWIVLIST